jgi:hypothetical protein
MTSRQVRSSTRLYLIGEDALFEGTGGVSGEHLPPPAYANPLSRPREVEDPPTHDRSGCTSGRPLRPGGVPGP